MSSFRPSGRARRAPYRPRGRLLRALLVAVALVLAFLLGIAFSRTLDERPEEGAPVTTVRTVSLSPGEGTSTVTVTVTVP